MAILFVGVVALNCVAMISPAPLPCVGVGSIDIDPNIDFDCLKFQSVQESIDELAQTITNIQILKLNESATGDILPHPRCSVSNITLQLENSTVMGRLEENLYILASFASPLQAAIDYEAAPLLKMLLIGDLQKLYTTLLEELANFIGDPVPEFTTTDNGSGDSLTAEDDCNTGIDQQLLEGLKECQMLQVNSTLEQRQVIQELSGATIFASDSALCIRSLLC